MSWINKIIKKHNEKIMVKRGFFHCAKCNKLIHKTDKYCSYCGDATEIKT